MQCDSVSAMLDAYLDGELSLETSAAIREHLTGCTRCSTQVADMPGCNAPFASPGGTSFRALNFASACINRSHNLDIAHGLCPGCRWQFAVAGMVLLVLLWVGHRQTSGTIAEMADLHVNALQAPIKWTWFRQTAIP